jgi:hypothetical protein
VVTIQDRKNAQLLNEIVRLRNLANRLERHLFQAKQESSITSIPLSEQGDILFRSSVEVQFFTRKQEVF